MSARMTDVSTIMPSPVGNLRLVASETALVAVLWEREPPGRVPVDAAETTADHALLHGNPVADHCLSVNCTQ